MNPEVHAGVVRVFGVDLIGATPENGRKLLLTIAVVILVPLIGWALTKMVAALTSRASKRVSFWTRQAISLFTALLLIVLVLSIWFDDPRRLTTAAGLVTAGIAFAMQRVITALAGYFMILRGNIFNVGDRIVIGGVRGDVIALSFLQTQVMEMGEAQKEQPDAPAVWVHSRQYTGRIVTVSNSAIFDQPVYNYSREFPFIFEEMTIPIRYEDDWTKAEDIVLEAARKHTLNFKTLEEEAIKELKRRYYIEDENPGPRVYWHLTDNWLEMTVRFVVRDHGVRGVKDAMSREIIQGLKAAGMGLASGTYAIVQVPDLKVQLQPPSA